MEIKKTKNSQNNNNPRFQAIVIYRPIVIKPEWYWHYNSHWDQIKDAHINPHSYSYLLIYTKKSIMHTGEKKHLQQMVLLKLVCSKQNQTLYHSTLKLKAKWISGSLTPWI